MSRSDEGSELENQRVDTRSGIVRSFHRRGIDIFDLRAKHVKLLVECARCKIIDVQGRNLLGVSQIPAGGEPSRRYNARRGGRGSSVCCALSYPEQLACRQATQADDRRGGREALRADLGSIALAVAARERVVGEQDGPARRGARVAAVALEREGAVQRRGAGEPWVVGNHRAC